MRSGFTLLELLVVVVIVGILVAVGMFSYTGIKEDALDKEAKAMLRLLQTAEKTYRLEVEAYGNCANTGTCNSLLGLDLTSGSSANWDYRVSNASPTTFCAEATRSGGSRQWRMDQDDDDPSSGSCP